METNNNMRETLVSVKKSIDGIGAASLDGDPEILLMSLTQVCARLSARIDAALAEPMKNCEVGTAEEQGERCLAQFNQWRHNGDNKKLITAIMEWAQMPYDEGDEK